MGSMSNDDLVRKSAYGDREAFAALVRKYANLIYSVAYSELRDFHLAQDIAQDCFVKAWFKIEQLEDGSRFGAWAVHIARNLCRDYGRKKRLHERPLDEAASIPDGLPLDDLVKRRIESQQVWQALQLLDDKYRTPAIMHYIGGYKAREIAELLEVPQRTIETRIRRAKSILRQELVDLIEQGAQEVKLGEAFVGKVKARIKNALQVRLVRNIDDAKQYYKEVLDFTVDEWGHAERDGVGLLLQQAQRPEDVRPNAMPAASGDASDWPGPPTNWDTYAYSDYDGVQSLYEEFVARGAVIAYPPIVEQMGDRQWKEFAVRDADGYVIVFGGGN